jgi:quercetin dioxygenase-like cupin family protein
MIMKIRRVATVLFLAAIPSLVLAQDAPIFPKGEKAPNVHHTGDVWLNHLSDADSTFDFNVVVATFAAGAKLDWHMHPAGQQLLITKGTGYYQERGEAVQIVQKGDVIKCPPGIEHWHAATPETGVTYLAITGNAPTEWFERVPEETFTSINVPAFDSSSAKQEIMDLSREKWQWMAEKNVEALDILFHDKAEFVHMGGSWGKERELSIIESGGIWYKNAEVHDTSVNVMGNTAILLNRITLLAEVGGNEVTNPFEVTEVYVKQNEDWKLASLSFTRLRTSEEN